MGRIYDLRGPFTLLAVVRSPPRPRCFFAFSADECWWIWVGVAIWGVVNGVLGLHR